MIPPLLETDTIDGKAHEMHQSMLSKYLLFAIFAVSGFSGLIYESIWSHYLKLFLGHAAYAQTLVLAIFMGGMALGSWVIARRSQRWRNLLLGYVAVEGIIGLFGLVFHQGFVSTTDVDLLQRDPRTRRLRLGAVREVERRLSANPAAVDPFGHDLPAHEWRHPAPVLGSTRRNRLDALFHQQPRRRDWGIGQWVCPHSQRRSTWDNHDGGHPECSAGPGSLAHHPQRARAHACASTIGNRTGPAVFDVVRCLDLARRLPQRCRLFPVRDRLDTHAEPGAGQLHPRVRALC